MRPPQQNKCVASSVGRVHVPFRHDASITGAEVFAHDLYQRYMNRLRIGRLIHRSGQAVENFLFVGASLRFLGFMPRLRTDLTGERGDDDEHPEFNDVARVGDEEGIIRLSEKKVDERNADECGTHRCERAQPNGDDEHEQDVNHGEICQREPVAQQPGEQGNCNQANTSDEVLSQRDHSLNRFESNSISPGIVFRWY